MSDTMTVTRVLVVSPFEEDHEALRRILRDPQWTVSSARSLLEAWITLHRTKIDVVVAECDFENGLSWRELLEEICEMRHPQPVIVASRQADNRLWTEILNRGGYDILRKPFDVLETLHALEMASQAVQRARSLRARQRRPDEGAVGLTLLTDP
jgi:DNA-binding NtrC family response regulator